MAEHTLDYGSAAQSTSPQHDEPVILPSKVAPPTRSDTEPQQAATQPGDGSEVHKTKVPFKEQVIGYAQKTRGTALRKPSLKEHGDQVLSGSADAREPPPKA
ncbi:hypothetical protein OF83DRAFT_1147935 [Amylostereum chailletii]|nr:hypothetical protein OF83DRAFT_1147935 [Amylostereum chailletii]